MVVNIPSLRTAEALSASTGATLPAVLVIGSRARPRKPLRAEFPSAARGLMLVRKLMSEMRYEHSGGCNRLTLVKHLTPQPSA